MNLRVRFPGETEVILDDITRFRAPSAADRIRTIRNRLADVAFIVSKSTNAGWAKTYSEEQLEMAQCSIRDFIALANLIGRFSGRVLRSGNTSSRTGD
jgi:hypothetical protein